MDPMELKNNCGGLTVNEAESYIRSPKRSSMSLNPGETGYDIIRFSIPEGAPLCFIRYSITAKDPVVSGSNYVSRNFDISIKG